MRSASELKNEVFVQGDNRTQGFIKNSRLNATRIHRKKTMLTLRAVDYRRKNFSATALCNAM